MKVLIDADFILEALLNRENLIEDAEKLWNLLENQEIQGLMTDIGLKKICIFVKKLGGMEAVEQITSVIESMVNVQTVDEHLIEEARSFNSLDFESAVEIVCAYTWKVGAIVTQNIQSFSEAELPILSLSQLLERQILENQLLVFNTESLDNSINPSLVILNDEVTTSKKNIWNRKLTQGLLTLGMVVTGISSALTMNSKPMLVSDFFRKDFLRASDFYNDPVGLKEKNNSEIYDDLKAFNIALNMNTSDKALKTILDHDVYTIVTLYKDLESDFLVSSSLSSNFGGVFTVSAKTPEPSNLIGLGSVVSALGLGSWYKIKKNQVKNHKNNLQKSDPIPPISNLDCVIDDSKMNETETLPK